MWPDNETDVDLLGFDYLVDALEVVLTDETLYPITVGVLGVWGSGKTSLMAMAGQHLEQSGECLCIAFSPWRFESYDDVKTALMATVIRAVAKRVDEQERAAAESGTTLDAARMQRTKERLLGLWGRIQGFSGAVGTLATAGAAAAGLPPELATLAGSLTTTTVEQTAAMAQSAVADTDEPTAAQEPVREFTSAAEFRREFRALMSEIDGPKAVIVFVDDLDRCLPETIIETFEAIRLFLHVPRTAYVLAAHPAIVEAAVAYRYEGSREGDADLGRDYLEKIVQLPITVPALSEPEVETYINLLFAQRHLGAGSDDFERVLEAARTVREQNQIAVAMNYGIAKDILQREIDEPLQRQFSLAASIGPTLARGLKGNPRQIKRFLNALTLRLRTATKRGSDLDDAVLAKLMVLEYLHRAEFQRLFEWQLAQDGRPIQLKAAEALIRDGADAESVDEAGREWATASAIQAWLKVDPPLADIPLGRYFFFSREGLSPAAGAARLSGEQQELLARLHNSSGALRGAAVTAAVELDPISRNPLYDALLESAVRDPTTPAMRSAYEVAARVGELVPRLAEALDSVPPTRIPGPLPVQIKATFGTLPAELEAVIVKWHESGRGQLKTSAGRALSRTGGR